MRYYNRAGWGCGVMRNNPQLNLTSTSPADKAISGSEAVLEHVARVGKRQGEYRASGCKDSRPRQLCATCPDKNPCAGEFRTSILKQDDIALSVASRARGE